MVEGKLNSYSNIEEMMQSVRVLGAISSGVLLINSQGDILFANNAVTKLLGREVIELVGSKAADILAPWTKYIVANIDRCVAGHMDLLDINGQVFWVDWQLNPIFDDGQQEGWVMVLDDRSDHHHWQNAARKAERFATTATMVSALAHELRNPISAAKGMVQMVSRQQDSAKIRSYSDLALKELDRVTFLLNEFLMLGKPAEIQMVPLDMRVFLNDLKPIIQGEASIYDIKVEILLKEVPPVAADAGQLTQAVLNLVRNAMQAVQDNGLVRITLDYQPDNKAVSISVWDNGPGLPTGNSERIFDPFFSTKHSGTGLGLSIVQAIANNHGGEITAINHCQGGALFELMLPSVNKCIRNQKVDVMVIMMNELQRFPVEQILRETGHLIDTAVNIPQALAKDILPSVVVLEQDLVQSLDTLDHIHAVWPEVKVLFMGNPVKRDAETHLEYLPGEFDLNRFINKIKSMLQK